MNDTTPERWLPVVGWEGLYEVSDHGRVRGLRRGLILKPSYSNSGGYALLILSRDGRQFGRYIHHLVLEAFVGPRPEGAEVRHLDGDPRNSTLANLAYGTSGENKLDQVHHGTHPEASKTHCPQGHPYSPENTYVRIRADGGINRICKTCKNAGSKRAYRQKMETAPPCTQDGCERPQVHRGLCGGCYNKQLQSERPPCTKEGCKKPQKSRGLCGAHLYHEYKKNG